MKTIGIVLVAVGILALVYQGFTYTKQEKVVDLGPLQVNAEKQHTVWIPPVLGVLALVGGVALIAIPKQS